MTEAPADGLESSALDTSAAPATYDGVPPEVDEAAESAFLAEARERGEPVSAPKSNDDAPDESDTKPLPALHELVERIPPEVRETLEDLFRARFVTVKRVPKRALKN